ncbi:MAG: TRAP transporter small permease subunit [Alphaproteobacteria bacterium]|nr:TRAP transporter small permease subunit [Alphaproteobacteria bacterium]
MTSLSDKAGAAGEIPAEPSTLPRTRISDAIDSAIRRIGEASSWLWMILMLVIVVNVAARYLFGAGSVMMEELQWHIYGVTFLIGLAYCTATDRHVRIDVLHERWRPRTKAWVEFVGIMTFLLPFALSVLIDSVPFVLRSIELHEISDSPGGLSHRWIIKSAITLGFALLSLAAFSRLTRCTALLFNFPKPLDR